MSDIINQLADIIDNKRIIAVPHKMAVPPIIKVALIIDLDVWRHNCSLWLECISMVYCFLESVSFVLNVELVDTRY